MRSLGWLKFSSAGTDYYALLSMYYYESQGFSIVFIRLRKQRKRSPLFSRRKRAVVRDGL